jgi:hypothetical protein
VPALGPAMTACLDTAFWVNLAEVTAIELVNYGDEWFVYMMTPGGTAPARFKTDEDAKEWINKKFPPA